MHTIRNGKYLHFTGLAQPSRVSPTFNYCLATNLVHTCTYLKRDHTSDACLTHSFVFISSLVLRLSGAHAYIYSVTLAPEGFCVLRVQRSSLKMHT